MNSSCDVLVAGGGVAGVAAAVAAARQGMRTCLVEKRGFPGGIGCAGLLNTICGLYLNGNDIPGETLNMGLAREIEASLGSISSESAVQMIGRVFVLPYSGEVLRSVLESLCHAEPNLRTFMGATVVSVDRAGEGVRRVSLRGSDTTIGIEPSVVIDCSGTGEISAMAGAEFEMSPPEELQLAAYILHIKGLKDYDEGLRLKVPWHLNKAATKGIIRPETRFSMLAPGPESDEAYLKISVWIDEKPESRQKAIDDAHSTYRYLTGKIEELRGSYILRTSDGVMGREGRRIKGDYTLTEQDVLEGRKFPDGAVKNSWPIEIWDRDRGTIYKYPPKGDYYEIPFRCLKVKGFENLLTAGRCISVTHEAFGSTRVMGTCISLGEQAGIAAAHKIRTGDYR